MVSKASWTDETASSCTSCACAIGNSVGRWAGQRAVSAPSTVRAGLVPSFWHFRRMQEVFLRPPGPFAIRVRAAMARSTAQHGAARAAVPRGCGESCCEASRSASLSYFHVGFASDQNPNRPDVRPGSNRTCLGSKGIRKGIEGSSRGRSGSSRRTVGRRTGSKGNRIEGKGTRGNQTNARFEPAGEKKLSRRSKARSEDRRVDRNGR